MPFLLFLLGFVVSSSPSLAVELDSRAEYADCMLLTRRDPEAAYEKASRWQGVGGGAAAKHCAAVALIGQSKYKDAGMRLEALANEPLSLDIKAGVLSQAGQAWFLMGDYSRALAAQEAAFRVNPSDGGHLVDMGLSLAAANNHADAEIKFSKALDLMPNVPDILAFRASSRRLQNKLDLAMTDVETALAYSPGGHLEALLERGMIFRIQGDNPKAKADWLKIMKLAPDSSPAQLARRNLDLLEVK